MFLVPLGVLLYTLMIGSWEAGKAGMLAVGVTVLVGCLQKATRPSWRGVMDAVEGTGRTMLDLIAITTLAGIVIGAFQLSGLTSKLPILLISAAGGNVFLLLVLTAVVSIVLGMSLPTTVVYVTLAVLIGPALTQLGIDAAGRAPVPVLLRHALADHAARLSGHVRRRRHRQGRLLEDGLGRDASGRRGLRRPVHLRVPSGADRPRQLGEILVTMLTASIGVVLLGIGCAGYLFRPLSWSKRGWAWAAAALLMMPPLTWLPPSTTDLFGLAFGVALVTWERRARPVGAAAGGVVPPSTAHR